EGPEPPGGQPQQRLVVGLGVGGDVHEGAGGEVGQVADGGHQLVVEPGLDGHDLGPGEGDQVTHRREGGRVGGGGGGEDPGGAVEQIGGRPLDALVGRAGHRVAAHEPGG